MTKHTEDCLDANDDTSVLKGKCICPKPIASLTDDELLTELFYGMTPSQIEAYLSKGKTNA